MGDRGRSKKSDVEAAKERGKIEWMIWGNTLAVFAAPCYIVGGILGQIGVWENSAAGVVTMLLGFVIFFVEWPRPKRARGRTIPRMRQDVFNKYLLRYFGGSLLSNLFLRGVIYWICAVPAFFELPTMLGGAVLAISGIVYVVAGFKGETWKHTSASTPRRQASGQTIAAPTAAPPRAPPKKVPPTEEVVEDKIVQETMAGGYPHDGITVPLVPTARSKIYHDDAPTSAPPMPPIKAPIPSPSRAPPVPKPTIREKPKIVAQQPTVWEEAKDPSSGDSYYINNVTDETTWDRPQGVPVKPYAEA